MNKNETFADRLKLAMDEAGYTQASLGEAIGMAQPSVWKLVTGKTKNTRKLYEIARVLRVNPDWLLTGKGQKEMAGGSSNKNEIPDESEWVKMEPWDDSTPIDKEEVLVPFLKDVELACGDGTFNEEDYNGFKLRFSKATLRRVGANTDGSGVICFPASGNSMEPYIPHGTTVAINTNDKKIVDGKIYAINENGWKRIKVLRRSSPNMLNISSFNSEEYDPEEKPVDSVEIIGRLFWYSVIV
ncbi:XRE family transcriptional regulator [Shewanella algae]|uniref:XRE family transcriptional regulator n=1 Tax=Shewanella algae TaxID=38313 RepID=UPI001AAC4F69|nr:helix-turn-helix transcriptional regulator [Shewanella algae]MBO2578158.1 helix-turn-helix transcriptional regulator [Shewanella algae]MBO2700805.1 helix-turn-helix transcriptional regulator [Shewanella algae]HDS1203123.1 helix-turn-helix transcriptional regulator [Shewanella algae]